jgi:hypothetical protein
MVLLPNNPLRGASSRLAQARDGEQLRVEPRLDRHIENNATKV